VLHYGIDAHTYLGLSRLVDADPTRRIWRLGEPGIGAYMALYNQVLAEHTLDRPAAEAAVSAQLRLLLVHVARADAEHPATAVPKVRPDVLAMLQAIRRHEGDEPALLTTLRARFVNYDSLRHRFRQQIGESPTAAWRRVRLQRATNLLLTTDWTVKEIAARLGFARQHEFTRAFTQSTGESPTAWRKARLL
jgi:AraC-like DNA-binding protein